MDELEMQSRIFMLVWTCINEPEWMDELVRRSQEIAIKRNGDALELIEEKRPNDTT